MEGVSSLLQCQVEQMEALKRQVEHKRSELNMLRKEAKEASGIQNAEKIPAELSQVMRMSSPGFK